MSNPRARLPLSALLSAALVAFTVEFDNEFEHRMPHRTTNHGATPGATSAPWLVSMAMWIHCMRHVPEEGIGAGELARHAQLSPRTAETILKRMSRWWGYLSIEPVRGEARSKSSRSAWLVRPTPAGRQAQRIWEPLTGEITDRWRARIGSRDLDALQRALTELRRQFDPSLPAFLPIDRRLHPRPREGDRADEPSLPGLLSGILYAYALEFESGPGLPLRLSANVLRALDADAVSVSRLPALTGIAPMGVENSISLLKRSGHLEVVKDPAGGRARVARPTAAGRAAQTAYAERVPAIECSWETRFGAPVVRDTRRALERLVGGGTAVDSPLFAALEPHPDGWRAQVPRPDTLPHFPMVSHRGGFPDGS